MLTVSAPTYSALRAKYPDAIAIMPFNGGYTGSIVSTDEDFCSEFIESEYRKTFSES